MLRVVLRIAQCHRHVEPVQGAAGLDAERAGMELVQRQAFGLLLDLGLGGGVTLALGRAADPVAEHDELAEADPQGFDDHGLLLSLGARRPNKKPTPRGRLEVDADHLIRLRNSLRVAALARNSPSITEVIMLEFCFSTPRIIMHMCLASMTTATPAAPVTCEMASAI